jgi:hypothetical protein
MTTPAGTGGESISYYRSRPRRRSTLSLTIRTALLAGLASVVIAAGLALQMAVGADPALKAGAQGADSQRKIVRTTVVRRVAGLGEGSGTGAASAPPISSAPVVSSPAPVTSSTS